MNAWQFTSEAYPVQTRDEYWKETLERFGFRTEPTSPERAMHDVAVSRTSPGGVEFIRISSNAQSLSHRCAVDRLLVCLPVEGSGMLEPPSRAIKAGDVVIVPPGQPLALKFSRRFRLLIMRVPQELVSLRVVGPDALKLTHVRDRAGLGKVFSSLLELVGENLETLTTGDFRALDVALAEMILACLATGTRAGSKTGSSGQAVLLHRIRQDIEARLADPSLSPVSVAQAEGLSERYVQKLFEAAGESFTTFVRRRRLERCRSDLHNPQCDHLSISDICFRWGFNDASHFSRAFRDQFGLSPRAYRHQTEAAVDEDGLATINRGRPQQSRPALRHGERADPPLKLVETLRLSSAGTNGCSELGQRSHYLPANDKTVHWGYFSRALEPVIEIESGDRITVETLTQHATDDWERMVAGDPGAESVFHWNRERKNVDRRGAGPADASVFGRGSGEGFGVHICTGPIAVRGARPGDVIEVRILDISPRPSAHPLHAGRAFGSNAASWWGYHYRELLTEPKQREVVTLYEIGDGYAHPLYNYRWTPQTDPSGVTHATMDYPGVPVDPASVKKHYGVMGGVRVPLRPHFGVIGVAPRETDLVDSTPPSYFGGNIDNWRAGKGASVYLPVSVPGALLSIGDPHAAQGDCELSGTAIECSLTGVLQVILHKKADLAAHPFADLTYPLIETADEWVLLGFNHPNYLAELGENAQSEVYSKSSLDLAMKDAFRKMRRFLMTAKGLSEDEAISLMSVAVDFGVTQVVDGNWGVHAILRKDLFASDIEAE